MKLYLIGLLASALVAVVVFVGNNKPMNSKLLLRPGESISRVILHKRSQAGDDSNILVKKILSSYDSKKISYQANNKGDDTFITVDTAIFGINDDNRDKKTIFTVVPLVGNYSILIQFTAHIAKECMRDCPSNIKADFELRQDIHSQIVDPSLCHKKGCYFLGQAEYTYSIKDYDLKYETKLPKTLKNIDLEEAFAKMFNRSVTIANHFPISESSHGNYEDYTYDIMDDSEDFPDVVERIVNIIDCSN